MLVIVLLFGGMDQLEYGSSKGRLVIEQWYRTEEDLFFWASLCNS